MRLETVVGAMCDVPGFSGVHDLHIWSLGTKTHALSCHVLIDDMPPSESDPVLRRINQVMAERFHHPPHNGAV